MDMYTTPPFTQKDLTCKKIAILFVHTSVGKIGGRKEKVERKTGAHKRSFSAFLLQKSEANLAQC